ncbi:MAG: ERAP1-like C-terminal domain-containing protein, partial [Candidatus Omnitrophica bacterium]|nr:ERAP1-like C-terminal domain-containing protein [Candidatus Omnitrophota bacterium]
HGGAKEFDRLLNVYTSAGLQEEKVRVLRAMTRFRTPELVRRAHRFALSGEVRAQDTFIILAGLGSNSFAREANWKFVKSNWSTLVDRFAGGLNLLGHIVEGSVAGFSGALEFNDAAKFFKAHPQPGIERTIKQSLEMIRSNIIWRRRDAKDVKQWFGSR